MWLAYRGWSVLLVAPAAALVAAGVAREPFLAHWIQTFMGSAAQFIAQFFPLFLLGALFGKLMDDSGSVQSIARFMIAQLGTSRAVLAVVIAGALVTYGRVSVFVAFFVLGPMAQAMFRAAGIPRRLTPAAIALGTLTFTMSALPGRTTFKRLTLVLVVAAASVRSGRRCLCGSHCLRYSANKGNVRPQRRCNFRRPQGRNRRIVEPGRCLRRIEPCSRLSLAACTRSKAP
jgi:GntP family permease